MRLLLHPKDNPYTTNSGYGIAAFYMIQGLKKFHQLGVYAPVGTKYKIHYYEQDIPVYPGTREDFGEDLVKRHYDHFKANAMIQMADVWALSKIPELSGEGKKLGDFIWVIQPPVDWMDPTPAQILDRLRAAYRVVPWVTDAQVRLKQAGLNNVADPIPIGLDTYLWQPLDRRKFPLMMESLGFAEDTFNILIPGANQFLRKAWGETFEAIKLFQDNNPDVKVRVFAHAIEAMGDGWDLPTLAKTFKVDTRGPDTYQLLVGGYQEMEMVQMFNCADVIVNAGLEGFGLATIQAQACGKPVIGMNYGPTPELVKDGILVPVKHAILTPPNFKHGLPDPVDIERALEYIYNAAKDRWKNGPEWIRENFNWDHVIRDKWLPFLEQLESDLEKDCIQGPPLIADSLRTASQEIVSLE